MCLLCSASLRDFNLIRGYTRVCQINHFSFKPLAPLTEKVEPKRCLRGAALENGSALAKRSHFIGPIDQLNFCAMYLVQKE